MAAEVQPQRSAMEQILQPMPPPTFDFSFNNFLRREFRFGLDPNRAFCKAYMQGHCPLGKDCPDKHHVSSSYNNLVCKHWLRGLCKKGDTCEFLHEYNLRRMPDCSYYSRTGTCSNGEDCLYLHVDPESKRPPCPHYERGFCPLGPYCANKHVKRDRICPFYMAGFCPDGKTCKNGAHPRFPTDLKKPEVRVEKSKEEIERERMAREQERQKLEEKEREQDPGSGAPTAAGQKFRGGWGRGKKRSGGRHRR